MPRSSVMAAGRDAQRQVAGYAITFWSAMPISFSSSTVPEIAA
jgi:hypothetical protein